MTLNGRPAAYTVEDTHRGREVLVAARGVHVTLEVTTR